MKILRAVILVFVFLLPSANAFGAVKAFIHDLEVDPGGDDAQTKPTGIQFNPDGTKMYIVGLADDAIHSTTYQQHSMFQQPHMHQVKIVNMEIRFNKQRMMLNLILMVQ